MPGASGDRVSVTRRYPLSSQQQMWSNDGALIPRFVMAVALRINGEINNAALKDALDDIVVRHEVLRTTIAGDGESSYQMVHQPSSVPLNVRDLPGDSARARKLCAEKLLIEAEQSTLDVNDLPLLRAVLGKFDDRDSVLTLVTHHSACDGWSIQAIIRDLAECYAARVDNRPPVLPPVRQYREYAAQQVAYAGSTRVGAARDYWRRKLEGARFSTLPTDRPVPERHTQPYMAHYFTLDPEMMSMASSCAKSMRVTTFMVLLATFNVLSYQLTGKTDTVINTITNGRNERQFQDTVGVFLNFLPLRTSIGSCGSFSEVLDRTRGTCLDALSNEIPDQWIERDIPSLTAPLRDPMMSEFIFGYFKRPFDSAVLRIADGSYEIRERELRQASAQLPGGAAWTMSPLPTGGLKGHIAFNPEEFDEGTIAAWTQAYRRILASVVADPDRQWKTL